MPRPSDLVLVLVLVLEGCSRKRIEVEAEAGVDAAAIDAATVVTRAEDSGASDSSTSRSTSAADEGFDSPPRSGKSIGHTSIVFRLDLASGKRAAFKPASRRGPLRYKGEVAAYRLGGALGILNVPRAFYRALDAHALSTALGAGNAASAELYAKEAIVSGGAVKGALIPWIDNLDFVELERDTTWKTWLRRDGTIPDDQRARAREISILVCFDFLSGNWDRWSGGNVGLDKASGMLLFIDNDSAFFEVPPTDALQKNKRLLRGIDRFSRSFVDALRELDDDALDRAVGEETPGVPLLSAKALAGVHQRRKDLLVIVDSKRNGASDAALYAFP